jgi:hypothetical protein
VISRQQPDHKPQVPPHRANAFPALATDLLILPDGRILTHNLTPVMAAVLKELNPDDKVMEQRAGSQSVTPSRQ